MVPGSPVSKGSDAIRNDLKQMLGDPAMALSFHASTVDVAKSGDLAFTQGSYNLTVTDPTSHKVINDHGNYVTTYRKQADGTWKAVADIATSDVPPGPPAH
jgi:ketosteroid isomerase-like protein